MKHLRIGRPGAGGAALALLLAPAHSALAQLPPAWPDQPLAVTTCAPTQALEGTRVVVRGQGFVGVSSVRFNGIEAEEFTVDSPTQLTALVPPLARTGPISVSTAAGTAHTVQYLEVPPEVVVLGRQTLRGTYARVVVGPTGAAALGGPVAVLGTLVVQPGGQLTLGSHVVSGGGFVLAAGAVLGLSHPAGLAATGASGAVQTATRRFSAEASYVYGGTHAGNCTGTGLPARVRGLAVANPAGLTLSGPLAIGQALYLAGPLTTGGHALTLLTTPSLGPALLLGTSQVRGAVRVQPAAADAGEPATTTASLPPQP